MWVWERERGREGGRLPRVESEPYSQDWQPGCKLLSLPMCVCVCVCVCLRVALPLGLKTGLNGPHHCTARARTLGQFSSCTYTVSQHTASVCLCACLSLCAYVHILYKMCTREGVGRIHCRVTDSQGVCLPSPPPPSWRRAGVGRTMSPQQQCTRTGNEEFQSSLPCPSLSRSPSLWNFPRSTAVFKHNWFPRQFRNVQSNTFMNTKWIWFMPKTKSENHHDCLLRAVNNYILQSTMHSNCSYNLKNIELTSSNAFSLCIKSCKVQSDCLYLVIYFSHGNGYFVLSNPRREIPASQGTNPRLRLYTACPNKKFNSINMSAFWLWRLWRPPLPLADEKKGLGRRRKGRRQKMVEGLKPRHLYFSSANGARFGDIHRIDWQTKLFPADFISSLSLKKLQPPRRSFGTNTTA